MAELRAPPAVLGVRASLLAFHDGRPMCGSAPGGRHLSALSRFARCRDDVRPDGAYGHPDHNAICSSPQRRGGPSGLCQDAAPPLRWPAPITRLAGIDGRRIGQRSGLCAPRSGVERHATPWPDWAITTVIDTRDRWVTVSRAISCHESQVAAYERLKNLSPEHHQALWGWQSFYRAFSSVNGGRAREENLFEGIPR
jgi:LmbE family N-acetylglucosaminyl deacetylase